MSKYKHILIAIDLFNHSEPVIKKAYEIAKLNGAKLSAVHVIEPLPGIGFEMISSAEIEMELMKLSRQQLEKEAKKYDIPKTRQFIEFGSIKHEIIRIASENHVDLIVIGSHGRHGLNYLLGSTANGVVQSADCDVLVIRIKN
ncbi:MAG: universal stress protein [Gammaproteobacteria bacterium]|nr:universal stress protein [Gammaproteobacteria bacterium]